MQVRTSSTGQTSWARLSLEGAGVGILLTLGLTWNQLSPTHLDLYHKLLPITTVVRAITIDLVVACLLGIVLVILLERLDAAGRSLVWVLFFAALTGRVLTGLIVAQVVQRQGVMPLLGFLVVGGTLLLLWFAWRWWYVLAIRGLRIIIVLLGCCIFWIAPILVAAGLARQPRDPVAFQKPLPVAAIPHRRIVWLLFDEMSYDQVFAHRWPGLELPNFDRLRQDSVTFSDAQPDGYFTERIIPSLFLGKPIVNARSTEAGQLRYQSAEGGPWASFDENATLFADAHRAGWTTGIAGAYNPYCRILANQLDSCSMQLIVFGDHLSRDKSTWGNFTAPAHAAWARAMHQRFEPAQSEAETFAGRMDAARRLVTNNDIDFAFVHLFLPHPPGVYDRKVGRVRLGGSYIDNLALSDRSLEDLVRALNGTGSAGNTTLIISSDHSWRVPLWRHELGWTREDELASGHGHFDPRPMLMVHFPRETQPADIGRPVPLLAMHEMIDRIIAGQILTQQQLKAWAAQQEPSG